MNNKVSDRNNLGIALKKSEHKGNCPKKSGYMLEVSTT